MMDETGHEAIEKNVRRAAGIRALRKISRIVTDEQRIDEEKAAALRWFARYGWIMVLGGALLIAFILGMI